MTRWRDSMAYRPPTWGSKPHFIFYDGIWDCIMPSTIRGFGYKPEDAYADWRQINVEKGRIKDDPSLWPVPCAGDDRRRGSR